MGRKSRKSLGRGSSDTPKVKNSQFRSRKLDQSHSTQDVLAVVDAEYSETPITGTGVKNLLRKNMKK
jgi:hypothetical protein